RHAATRGDLFVLAANALALMVALVARQAAQHTSGQTAGRCGQINLAGHAAKLDLQLVAEVDERLKHAQVATGEPVKVVDEHAPTRARPQVSKQPLILRSPLAAPGADVVVDVTLGHQPPALLCDPLAVRNLPPHPKLIALAVRRDPRVDTDPERSTNSRSP